MVALVYALGGYESGNGCVSHRQISWCGCLAARSGIAVACRGDDASGRRFAVVAGGIGDELAVDACAGFNRDGLVGDVASYFTAVEQFNTFACYDIANDLTCDADVLGTDVAMYLCFGTDDEPAVFTNLLLKVTH